MVAVGIDELAHRSFEAAARGIELADIAAAPQEIEDIVILERKAVDPFDEEAFGDILIRPVGLAGRRTIEPGIAADAFLHQDRTSVVLGKSVYVRVVLGGRSIKKKKKN